MTDLQREHLSAAVDGELSAEELRFLLKRMDHEAGLRAAWSRYHLARDGLRRQLPTLASGDFADRVAAALHDPAGAGRALPRWLRWSAGGAVAAGVAVAGLMLAQPDAGDLRSGTPQVASVAPAPTAVAASARPAQATAPATVPPWLSAANAYRYSERAAATVGEPYGDVVLPYTRELARYPSQRVVPGNAPGVLLLQVQPRAGQPSRRAPALQ